MIVSGNLANGSPFVERTKTLAVNAHGALIQLHERALVDQILRIKNVATNEEVVCTVVDISHGSTEFPKIGIGFSKPAPSFWRVAFPPEDWSRRGPEAKRPSNTAASNSSLSETVKK